MLNQELATFIEKNLIGDDKTKVPAGLAQPDSWPCGE